MENDVQRWDKKYRQAALAPILQIDPLLESHVVLPTGQKKRWTWPQAPVTPVYIWPSKVLTPPPLIAAP